MAPRPHEKPNRRFGSSKTRTAKPSESTPIVTKRSKTARPHSGVRGAAIVLATIVAALGTTFAVGAEALPRAKIVLPNTISVDTSAQTVTLPLLRGRAGSETVWYIVTDSSNEADAKKRGAIYAPLIANVRANCAACVQHVTQSNGEVSFNGAPDFSKTREFTPGPTGFPPKSAAPGATASAAYSPFIRIGTAAAVINAPIVATGSGPFDLTKHTNTHERVVAIDTAKKTVTLLLVHGFANGKPVLYISTEATDPGVATIERATYVPSLGKVTAGTIPIFVVANGPTGAAPQGLAYAALDGRLTENATAANASTLRAPMNVLASFPTGPGAAAYTPLWSANVGVWSNAAVAAHRNVQLTSPQAFSAAVARKDLTGPGGKPFGPIGVLVNCAVVAFTGESP